MWLIIDHSLQCHIVIVYFNNKWEEEVCVNWTYQVPTTRIRYAWIFKWNLMGSGGLKKLLVGWGCSCLSRTTTCTITSYILLKWVTGDGWRCHLLFYMSRHMLTQNWEISIHLIFPLKAILKYWSRSLEYE